MKKWRLDPSEVIQGMGSSGASVLTSGNYNRKTHIRTYNPRLYHEPTGVSVEENLKGMHSKKEWDQLIEKSYKDLFPKLEKMVAKHLRLPGW